MKISLTRLLGLLATIVPMMATAQNNIQSAFDAIINCPAAQITEKHTLDKDPSTNVKTGQSDEYNFVLPMSKINLVRNVVLAFDKDSDMAFSINKGKASSKDSSISLAVGDGSENGIRINNPDHEYMYAMFLSPLSEDPDGNYRYAYGINYKEEGNEIKGKLVVTYATTLKYRQQQKQERNLEILRGFSNDYKFNYSTNTTQKTWFEMLMSYLQSMPSANSQTRIALASKAYRLIQESTNYPEVTEADKVAAREILKGMISDKEYSETVLNKLLNQCLTNIK